MGVVSALVATPARGEGGAAGWTGSLATRVHSAYVSEGRENLDGKPFLTTVIAFERGSTSAFAWAGQPADGTARELNVGVRWAREWRAVSVTLGATWLTVEGQEPDDAEVVVELATAPGAWTVGLSGVASAAAGGTFAAVSVGRLVALSERVELVPSVTLGADFGYASEDVDDWSHAQAGLALEAALSRRVTLQVEVHHSLALEDVEASGGSDLTFGSVGLAVTF